MVLILAGRPLEAESVLRRSMAISRASQSDETVQPMVLINSARVLHDLGRFDEASRLCRTGVCEVAAGRR